MITTGIIVAIIIISILYVQLRSKRTKKDTPHKGGACRQYEIENESPQLRIEYSYMDCQGKYKSKITNSLDTDIICAKEGTIVFQKGSGEIRDKGACN